MCDTHDMPPTRHRLSAVRASQCLDTPATRSARIDALRFGVGDAVECRVDGGWHAGKVIALLYRDECMPAGVVAPYQARFFGSR